MPTLYDGDAKLFQSIAILEYLEEKYPDPALLPKNLLARAWVHGFALINAADSDPLIVPRMRNYLTNVLKVDEAARNAWTQHWVGAGLQAMEQLLGGEESDRQVLPRRQPDHRRHVLSDSSYAGAVVQDRSRTLQRVMRIYDTCMAIPAFADEDPRRQPDFEEA